MRAASATGGHAAAGAVAGDKDIRFNPSWPKDPAKLHRYTKASHPDDKMK